MPDLDEVLLRKLAGVEESKGSEGEAESSDEESPEEEWAASTDAEE